MRKRLLLWFGLILSNIGLAGQGLKIPPASPGLGMAAYSTEPDIFSFFENIAVLSKSPTGVGAYSERSFFLSPLQFFSVAGALSAFHGSIGFSIKHFGYRSYQESEFGVAYARQLGAKVSIGADFNYYQLKIPGYISDGAPNARIGVLFYPTTKFTAGLDVYNPMGGKMVPNEKLATILRLGFGYAFNALFYMSVAVTKIEKQAASLLFCMHYSLNQAFFLETGFQTTASLIWMSVGYKVKNFRLDVRGSKHPWLGISNGVAVSYTVKRAAHVGDEVGAQ